MENVLRCPQLIPTTSHAGHHSHIQHHHVM